MTVAALQLFRAAGVAPWAAAVLQDPGELQGLPCVTVALLQLFRAAGVGLWAAAVLQDPSHVGLIVMAAAVLQNLFAHWAGCLAAAVLNSPCTLSWDHQEVPVQYGVWCTAGGTAAMAAVMLLNPVSVVLGS